MKIIDVRAEISKIETKIIGKKSVKPKGDFLKNQ